MRILEEIDEVAQRLHQEEQRLAEATFEIVGRYVDRHDRTRSRI